MWELLFTEYRSCSRRFRMWPLGVRPLQGRNDAYFRHKTKTTKSYSLPGEPSRAIQRRAGILAPASCQRPSCQLLRVYSPISLTVSQGHEWHASRQAPTQRHTVEPRPRQSGPQNFLLHSPEMTEADSNPHLTAIPTVFALYRVAL